MAKVSKILQLMEKGNAADFKNKCLDEIDIDMDHIDSQEDDENNDLLQGIVYIYLNSFTKSKNCTLFYLKSRFPFFLNKFMRIVL